MSSNPPTRPPSGESELSRWIKTIVGDERAFRESVIRQLAELNTRLGGMERKMDEHVAEDRGKFASVEQSIDATDEKVQAGNNKVSWILGGAAVGAFLVTAAIGIARLI